jgi:segregation and condensation protein A
MTKITDVAYKAELEGIKAPLGVILYLIKRDNIDIYDIPIAKITQDYLGYLDLMEELEIDLAGEFFVLAASLMRLKVQMLLRRDGDEEDPREEFVQNLLEYKKMVEASRNFRDMEEERRNVFQRPVPPAEKDYKDEIVLDLNLFEVMKAFRQIMAEFESVDVGEIVLEEFSIEDQAKMISECLAESGQVRFAELFAASRTRLEVVVTFMALLEMIKRLRVNVRQEEQFGEIWIYELQTEQEPDLRKATPTNANED